MPPPIQEYTSGTITKKVFNKDVNIELLATYSISGRIVNIETYPTHIAGLPVAINICCHVNRHVSRIL